MRTETADKVRHPRPPAGIADSRDHNALARLSPAERLNFLLTNRIPRKAATRFLGWFSKIEIPPVRWLSMAVWKLFVDDLRLWEAKETRFKSLHHCFTRELKPGARPVAAASDIVCTPCDAELGEFGDVSDLQVLQAKGFPYSIVDLFGDLQGAARYRNGRYATLRLKSSMYHRFHAPCDAKTREIRYISGDTWNVNPIALSVVRNLFCKNERAVIELETEGGRVALVAVAAILVASMRFSGVGTPINLDYRGANIIPFNRVFRKGDEVGYFEHGSTIVMFASDEFEFVPGLESGSIIRMGQPLMRKVGGKAGSACENTRELQSRRQFAVIRNSRRKVGMQ